VSGRCRLLGGWGWLGMSGGGIGVRWVGVVGVKWVGVVRCEVGGGGWV